MDAFVQTIQGYIATLSATWWGPPAWHIGTGLVFVLAPLILFVLYFQLVERWVIGWMQVRRGPNRVTFFGIKW